MHIKPITKICAGQDGAIYKSKLFRFNHKGACAVFDLSLLDGREEACTPIARFTLGSTDKIVPHSNAVFFGCDRYEEGDEYPLLYTNVYNNYSSRESLEDKLIGYCPVYRLTEDNGEYTATLVQALRIGFTENTELWRASEEAHGPRPYANFLIDTDKRILYSFVMRNEELGTRYFKLRLPSVNEGEYDPRFGVNTVTLTEADILGYFDCPYHRYIQGATYHAGKIYSTEGFTESKVNRPAIRVIDLEHESSDYTDIMELGFVNEPEFIDFFGDTCYYSDAHGNLFSVEF